MCAIRSVGTERGQMKLEHDATQFVRLGQRLQRGVKTTPEVFPGDLAQIGVAHALPIRRVYSEHSPRRFREIADVDGSTEHSKRLHQECKTRRGELRPEPCPFWVRDCVGRRINLEGSERFPTVDAQSLFRTSDFASVDAQRLVRGSPTTRSLKKFSRSFPHSRNLRVPVSQAEMETVSPLSPARALWCSQPALSASLSPPQLACPSPAPDALRLNSDSASQQR